MARSEEHETSAFTSAGREASFPPSYEDNKAVGEFSDESKWPTPKLMGRLALYMDFIQREDIMPRAKETSRRIIDHIIFELSCREGIYLIDDDPSTEPLDTKQIKRLLEDD